MSNNVRHVLGISGGKDSAALAIYLKQQGRAPNIEYFFTDTGAELPETLAFIDRLEAYLGQEIIRLGNDMPFEEHLKIFKNFLPSPKARWCTRYLKIRPFEDFVGDDEVVSYVGIRADELRDGYVARSKRITPVFPFKEDGLVRDDIFRILRETVGIPEYYRWRSRSGCYFCFYQRIDEWLGLLDNYPHFFQQAMDMEKEDPLTRQRYTWIEGMSLSELKDNRAKYEGRKQEEKKTTSWQEDILADVENDEYDDQACFMCSL